MKIGIIRCEVQSLTCPSTHCLQSIKNKNGEFARYDTVDLIGFYTCGGCDRNRADKVINRGLDLKERGAEAIHLGVCMVLFCPFRDIYEAALKEKTGLSIVRGTHPYKPPSEMPGGGYQVTYPDSSWAWNQPPKWR